MDWRAWINCGKEPTERMLCSPAARAVVEGGAREARRLSHDYVGAEHLLFAMAELESNSVSKILGESGITSELLRSEMDKLRYNAPEPTWNLPFTPRARRIWERAESMAREAGATRINEGHVLLSLLQEADGRPAKWFAKFGVGIEGLKERIGAELTKATVQ